MGAIGCLFVVVCVLVASCVEGKVIKLTMQHNLVQGNRIRGSELLLEDNTSSDEPDLSHRAVESRMNLGMGVHTVEVYAGGQKRVLIVDTGSGDTAFPCTNCKHCGSIHANPFYEMGSTASYISCKENDGLDLQECNSCSDNKCRYGQKYVEGSHWAAHKVSDTMALGEKGDFSGKVVFGCIFEEYGAFEEQRADGIMGMSRDADAIFLQFYRENVTDSAVFSQCISRTGGSLTIGGVDMSLNREEIKYTPLRKTKYHYWTVSLQSVQVGDSVLPVAASVYNEGRGCVLDSGTTFIYLPKAAETWFQTAWSTSVGKGKTYSTYFMGETYYDISQDDLSKLPKVCFNMQNDAQFCVEPQQYMKVRSGGRMATIFFKNFAHATIIGAAALRNHNVVYDVKNGRIGFARADCDDYGTVQAALAIETGGETFEQIKTWDLKLISLLLVTTGLVIVAFVVNHNNQGRNLHQQQHYEAM